MYKAPATANIVRGPTNSNVLHISVDRFLDSRNSDQPKSVLFSTTADRRLNLLDVPELTVRESLTSVHDSPILSSVLLKQRHLITTSMSGQLVMSDLAGRILETRRDHLKYVVRLALHETSSTTYMATAGWDAKVHIYKLANTTTSSLPSLDAPIATITLPTNPEALVFIDHPETSQPILIVTRRDSTNLFYYTIEPAAELLGKQNLSPHSNAWVVFSPSAIALCPTDNTLLAVATSSMPHMKLLIVRLLVPSFDQTAPVVSEPPAVTSLLDNTGTAGTPAAAQARALLVVQDREAAAIQIQCTTMAPQTAYSTPTLAWRPDGSGVWVNSDDGVVRGVEASTGKVVATLKGHEIGSKIRCLWAGWVEEDGRKQEWLVSGGFDQKLIVWKPEQ